MFVSLPNMLSALELIYIFWACHTQIHQFQTERNCNGKYLVMKNIKRYF